MTKKGLRICLAFFMMLVTVMPSNPVSVFATDDTFVIVDDTMTDSSQENYFSYTQATDSNGVTGWAADTKNEISGEIEAKTQHWVWNGSNSEEARKHTYSFTFVGTGVELVGVKNDAYNVFQVDDGVLETVAINGAQNTPTVLFSKKDLPYGEHTVNVTLPTDQNVTGLQVSYAKVFGSTIEKLEKTVIPHTKTSGSSNKFTYSATGWSAMGESDEHVWSDTPPVDNPNEIWYEVEFVGSRIDIYAGKNRPMGKVEYFIDGVSQGKYSLYNSSNINSTFIRSFAGLSEGKHTFRAEATGEKDEIASNTLIDCAKVVVYHRPYSVSDITLEQSDYTLSEGATQQLRYKVTPDYAQLKDVTYRSSDEDIVSVSDEGLMTANHTGTATITVASEQYAIEKNVTVVVTPTTPNIGGSIVDTDTQYTQDRYDEIVEKGLMNQQLTTWKNDKAISEIAIVSKDCKLKNVSITVDDLSFDDTIISSEHVTATFIKPNKAYNGPFLGYGNKDRPVPEDNGTNRSEVSDILYETGPVEVEFNKVQPIWLEFDIPKNAKSGTYRTTVTVSSDGIQEPLVFTYEIKVQDVILPDASTYKDTFDIELWQYPYSSAEYYDVEPFSKEHFDILRSSMEIYKEIGGHAITTTISEEAWSGQTYSKNPVHYPSMVKWTKNADGSFTYDYTDFDKWVKFNKDMGIADKIVLYSIAPWHNSFTYWDNGQLVYEKYVVGSDRYNQVWTDFLRDMIEHLMEKGWFDDAYIGIDERGFSKEAFDLIDSVRNIHDIPLKTAGAMDHFVDKHDLALRVTDLNVGDSAAAKNPQQFTRLLEEREALGYRTTLYSCTEHQPGQFSLSNPAESYWAIINAGKETAGFLRWAYDAWVEDPLSDTTHNAFEAGDCFLIYPDEKDAMNPISKSSVRLERMAEGIRDVNKIRMMVAEIPALQSEVDAMYGKLTTVPVIRHNFLNEEETAQLVSETNIFKKDLEILTERYLEVKENATDKVESVEITNGDQIITLGSSLQLQAQVNPSNVINNMVTWHSSNPSIVSINQSGIVSANKIGTVTITATSVLDETKQASIQVKVDVANIEESARVAYYSFDDETTNDVWHERNGIDHGVTFVDGKSGKAIVATETKNVTFDSESNIGENDAWTVSYWVKSNIALTERFSVLMDRNKDYSFDLKMASDRASGFHVGKNSGDVLTFSYDFRENNWYHVAWTQSKENGLSMYVNGVLVDTNAWTKTNTTKIPLDIIGGTGFDGLIDEVKVYNRVLTPSEVSADMLVKGLNIAESHADLWIDDTFTIETNLISDEEDKTITYTSTNPEVATVNEYGVVTALKRGHADIIVENKAGGYCEKVTVTVKKKLIISNTLPRITFDNEKYVSDIEKAPGTDRQYLGQPDMVRTNTGRLITAYPKGHGKGPIIMQISDDDGKTWTEKTDIPTSWRGSQETPTLYILNLADGTERIMMITACPGWGIDSDGNQYGWNTSYSDDNGETWSEYAHWYSQREDGSNNDVIVGMASLIQLKDETGNLIEKWMGVYHTYSYVNYKTYLTFDENGNEQWSEPEPYLSEYRDIESKYQMCEIGMFRSPDGKRIVGLARSQSHNNPATLIYSDNEGETWSEPMDLPGSLAGERHKAAYDPISGRLLITFREIRYDLNGNNEFNGNNDWTCGEWMAWVGTYEDLMNQEDGEYCFTIAEDFANNAKSGDTGYAGVVVLDDGTFMLSSYGHWDKDFSLSWNDGVTTDLCYIKFAKFKLGEVENDNDLINRSELVQLIGESKLIDKALYTNDSWKEFERALEDAERIHGDDASQQVQIDAVYEVLLNAKNALVEKGNKDDLLDLINKADKLQKENYSDTTWKVFEEALANAKTVLENETATDEDVLKAIKTLEDAMNQLDKKPSIESNPNSKPEEGSDVETGDNTNVMTLFILLVLAGGMIAVLNKNKIMKLLSKK